jgi:dihydroorotase
MNEVRPFLFCEPNMLVECERHKLQEVVAHKSALITDKLPHDAVVYPCQL